MPPLTASPVRRAGARVRRTVLRAVPGARMTPDFLIIGTKRGGSTSLFDYLIQHPDVLPPYVAKGSRYFDVHHDRGPRWFRSHFPRTAAARAHQRRTGHPPVTGEASPYIVFHPLSAGWIASELPDARLVVALRDPVERAWSHHRYEVARGTEPLDISAALDAEPARLAGEVERLVRDPSYRSTPHRNWSYLARGRYAEQLRHLWAFVPREQVLVLASEHLFADPEGAMNRVASFLDLRPYRLLDSSPSKANTAAGMPAPVRRRLTEYYAGPNEDLFALLGERYPWSAGTGE